MKLQIIFAARKYALKEIEKQKTVFKSWGILADWENNCYYTYDKSYIQKQIGQFYKLYKKVILNIIFVKAMYIKYSIPVVYYYL